MTTYIYSYNPHSASAKALARALGIKRIKHHNSKFKNRIDDVVINWGSSVLPFDVDQRRTINDPHYVKLMTNKLWFFNHVYDELTVPYAAGVHAEAQVRVWLDDGKTVVARTKLTGHSGEGIVLLSGDPSQNLPNAPLYTLYVPKKYEYRVHVYRREDGTAEVFDIQRKARKLDVPDEEVDWRVRNLAGGFIYQRENLTVPDVVTDVALKVFEQTGLDFGAVDIIYQEAKNKAFVLEINTAPGLTGTTLDKYVAMFDTLLQ